jgi:hypothetical protein
VSSAKPAYVSKRTGLREGRVLAKVPLADFSGRPYNGYQGKDDRIQEDNLIKKGASD